MPKRHHANSGTPEPDSDDQDKLETPTAKRPKRSDIEDEPSNTQARRVSQRKGKQRAVDSDDDDNHSGDEDENPEETGEPDIDIPAQEQMDEQEFEDKWEDVVRTMLSKRQVGKIGVRVRPFSVPIHAYRYILPGCCRAWYHRID